MPVSRMRTMNANARLEERVGWIRENVNRLAEALRPDQPTWKVSIGKTVLSYIESTNENREITIDPAVGRWSKQKFDNESMILIGWVALHELQAN